MKYINYNTAVKRHVYDCYLCNVNHNAVVKRYDGYYGYLF
jgi:hypothetical protein